MSHLFKNFHRPPVLRWVMIVGVLIGCGLLVVGGALSYPALSSAFGPETGTPAASTSLRQENASTVATSWPTAVITRRRLTPTTTPTPTITPTPTVTPSPSPTPTPTLDLSHCNAAGCGSAAVVLPTAEYSFDLLLAEKKPVRRICRECPKNPQLSETELDALVAAHPATRAQLRTIALSQQAYELAPGIVYIVYNNVHHVVVDLKEPGYVLRNIIPDTSKRGTLITPSYCLSPKSLVVTDADYHGLNGSNKTETGRDLFFHLGRAALYQRDNGRFDIGVIRRRETYDRTTISWGGGPIFIWQGRYDYNPEQEWFDPEALEHYRTKRWTKVTVAVSKDRKYLFISASYGLTLREHADNIIALGQKWGIPIDRAMRFDGSESGYLALRLGDHMVPVLNLEEPLIVNCLAIEEP